MMKMDGWIDRINVAAQLKSAKGWFVVGLIAQSRRRMATETKTAFLFDVDGTLAEPMKVRTTNNNQSVLFGLVWLLNKSRVCLRGGCSKQAMKCCKFWID